LRRNSTSCLHLSTGRLLGLSSDTAAGNTPSRRSQGSGARRKVTPADELVSKDWFDSIVTSLSLGAGESLDDFDETREVCVVVRRS